MGWGAKSHPMAVKKETSLTVESLKKITPPRQKQNITPEFVDKLNKMIDDPEYREYFQDNIVGYIDVLNNPNTNVVQYVNAVKYVSCKLMGLTNQDAWIRTFPDRYQRLQDEGKEDAYLRSLVCAYNRGKLVNEILQQALVPTWVLNQDKFQKAINVQAALMTTAKSEKVRTDAANSLLTHLKQPEMAKVSVDVNVKQEDSIGELRKAVTELSLAQAEAIRLGVKDAQAIAEAKIIEGEVE